MRCPVSIVLLSLTQSQEGFTARPLLENAQAPFYAAPTIAPVMWSKGAPNYLEHPQSAFEYYQTFGLFSFPIFFFVGCPVMTSLQHFRNHEVGG